MASELETRLTKGFSIDELISKTSSVMNTLLNTAHGLQIEISENLEFVGEDESHSLIVRLAEYPNEIVEFNTIFINPTPGYEDPAEEGWWGSTTIRAAADAPVKHLLAASLMTALSEINGQPIRDELKIWTSQENSGSKEFLEALSPKESVGSIDDALQKFLNRINVKE